MTGRSAGPGEVRVRFPTHPHSVRTARQLAADTLRAWDVEVLVDDVRLVVTELATNATLHSGARSFLLSLAVTPTGGVRVAVGDEGPVPAAAVVQRPLPGGATATPRRPETTTGRGLAIVHELADAWGVDVDGPAKWVWALLSHGAAGASDVDQPPAPAPVERAPMPPGWHVVRLVDCPVALSLAQDDHLDELVRELQLVGTDDDQPELAPVIRGLLDGQAQARHMGRRTAQDAAAEGRERVTVEMVLPSPAAEQVERLDEAVAAADALCEREQLLTLASSPDVRRLRAWMRDEVRHQIRDGRPPRSYDAFGAAGA
jgi:anti-sigma regulatory factor (Ser/Thr protein kinase)